MSELPPGAGLPAGTMILTPRGPVAVETLTPGTVVLTASGAGAPFQTVQDMRQSDFVGMMVRLLAGAIDDATPYRDLLLPAGHGLLVDDALIPAGTLIDGYGILAEPVSEPVTLFLPVLARHDAILAAGTAVETGLPSPEATPCAPRAEPTGALRAAIAWRAEVLGWAPPSQASARPERITITPWRQRLLAEPLMPARPASAPYAKGR